MIMIDGKMRPIALSIFSFLNMTNSCYMTLFPAVLALWNFWIHISITNSSDNVSNIELSIDDLFDIRTILDISNVDPDNCYI